MMRSKLPNIGTTIFTVMSQMASKYGAINLSQGFPDFEVSRQLIDLVTGHMKQGHNQYAPMPGLPQLREQIAGKVNQAYNCEVDADTEITITGGATEALYCAITTLIHPEDEAIIFEPAYDSYEPAILLSQGVVKRVKLDPSDFSIPWDEVEAVVTDKTKLVIVNTPHNPTGAVLKSEDLSKLESLVERHGLYVISDEVYEHIIFEGQEHQSILRSEILRQRGISVFSFGKTFHATGWKVGYAIAPQEITEELRKVHQFLNFSVNTPIQWALSEYLELPDNYLSVPRFYQAKRDLFLELVKDSRFGSVPSGGTYFQLLSYKDIDAECRDVDMAEKLTRDFGVASIPISVFYDDNTDTRVLRFCFAKTDETLEKAAEIICKI